MIEIYLADLPKIFSVALSGAVYRMRVYYADATLGGWFLDIAREDGSPLTNGIPLVTGADLLAQYGYLGMRGKLVCVNDLEAGEMPKWGAFPGSAHLVWIPDVA